MSILKTSSSSNKCFSGLINHRKYNWENPVEKNFFVKTKGLKIKVYGFSEKTKAENQCGAEAIRNLFPFYF